jgi:hypothetical protein
VRVHRVRAVFPHPVAQAVGPRPPTEAAGTDGGPAHVPAILAHAAVLPGNRRPFGAAASSLVGARYRGPPTWRRWPVAERGPNGAPPRSAVGPSGTCRRRDRGTGAQASAALGTVGRTKGGSCAARTGGRGSAVRVCADGRAGPGHRGTVGWGRARARCGWWQGPSPVPVAAGSAQTPTTDATLALFASRGRVEVVRSPSPGRAASCRASCFRHRSLVGGTGRAQGRSSGGALHLAPAPSLPPVARVPEIKASDAS